MKTLVGLSLLLFCGALLAIALPLRLTEIVVGKLADALTAAGEQVLEALGEWA